MQWVKGQSGNPRGRGSAGDRFAALVRTSTHNGQDLVDFALRVFAGEEGAELSARVDAMKWLADRGWGKAKEVIVIEDEAQAQPAALTTEALEAELGPEGTIQ